MESLEKREKGRSMTHLLFIFKILLLGLSIAQVLSTIQVYLSNLDYYRFLTAVQKAGYLAVPNEHVFSNLKNFSPAFNGGLFFTFTVGASLTIISFGLGWAWDRLFSRNKIILFVLFVLLLLCLGLANLHGFSPLITGYLLLIPFLTFLFTLKWLPKQQGNESKIKTIFPIITFLMLALVLIVWKPSKINMDRFLDIRDYLLLSNSIGKEVNAFYYENSLYSTQVFKSYGQQLLKTCRIEDMSDPSIKKRIVRILLFRDYLPVRDPIQPDLSIVRSEENLAFYNHGNLVLTASIKDFLRNPAAALKQFEQQTDRHRFLRGVTMFSILLMGAIILYFCSFAPFYLISGLFLRSTPQAIKAGILCPLACLLLLFVFNTSGTKSLGDPQNLSKAITSNLLHTRITGLKYMLRNKTDIAGFPSYHTMLNSENIPERYWLAKTLGVSRTPETRKSLHKLLDDPHFNVVCMALDSLGRRGKRVDIWPILSKIKVSDNWYEQWYAYRALRRLGWTQKESN